MPFKVDYSEEAGGVVIMALLKTDEQSAFEKEYLAAMDKMHRKSRQDQEKPRRGRGNWHNLFCEIVAHATHYAPEDNQYNLADPFGFKDTAVRMWRGIANASFADAKQYVESLIKGGSMPDGTEHDSIPDDAMTEISRLFDEAKRKAR